MTAYRTITIIFFVLVNMQLAIAQTGFQIRQFGTEDGLPSNGIKGLQWDDRTGFLWIATEAGIVRFDGNAFKTFSGEDGLPIGASRIMSLMKNNAGIIYSRDDAKSIFRIDQHRIVLNETRTNAFQPADNSILLNVSDRLYRHQFGQDQKTSFLSINTRLVPVGDTACLMIHDGQLYYYSVELENPVIVSSRRFFMWGMLSGQSILLVDNINEVFEFNINSQSLIPVQILFHGSKALSNRDNQFFWQNGMKFPVLINGNLAWRLSYDNGKLAADLICDTIPPHVLIRYVQYDEDAQSLFLGTDSRGIIVISKNSIQSKKAGNTPTRERVSYYAQVELPDLNILTNEGHVIGQHAPASTVSPVKGRFGNFTYFDEDSCLWYIQDNKKNGTTCLHRYSFKTKQTDIFQNCGIDQQTPMLRTGNQMYFASRLGIARLGRDSLEYLHRYAQGNPSLAAFDLKETEPGILAIATCDGLLRYKIREQQLDTLFNPGGCIRAIWKYKDYLFIGTYGKGIFILKNGRVKPLPLDRNQYLLFTHCFVADDYGFCWLSTNRGLFKVAIEAMINSFENNDAGIYYHYFGRKDGMAMTEMNGGCTPCALTLSNKIISFPTMDGLVWVDPKIASPGLKTREIFIDRLRINGRSFPPDSLRYVQLPPGTNDLELQLAYSAWGNRENNYIDYQLDNSGWQRADPDKETLLRFVALSPGDHSVRVRKINGFGADSYSSLELKFSIATPWYRKWWVYVLAAALASALVSLLLRLRTRQYRVNQQKLEKKVAEKTMELKEQYAVLEKNDIIKTRLISIISHDIITPLKFLALAGRNLLEKRNLMNEDLQDETIREMTTTSRELQSLSTNILNWIKYQGEYKRQSKELFNVHEMVTQILQVLALPAHQKQLRMANEVNSDLVVYQYYEPLKILLYNIISNAINFSEKGTIRISSKITGEQVVISVSDEGIGMTPEQVQHILHDQYIIPASGTHARKGHGLGFLIIKDLIKMTGVSLSIDSKLGAGTTVSIRCSTEKDL